MRSQSLTVRLTCAERDALAAASKARRVPMAELARRALRSYLRTPVAEPLPGCWGDEPEPVCLHPDERVYGGRCTACGQRVLTAA